CKLGTNKMPNGNPLRVKRKRRLVAEWHARHFRHSENRSAGQARNWERRIDRDRRLGPASQSPVSALYVLISLDSGQCAVPEGRRQEVKSDRDEHQVLEAKNDRGIFVAVGFYLL